VVVGLEVAGFRRYFFRGLVVTVFARFSIN
jgi:hypothetical protein